MVSCIYYWYSLTTGTERYFIAIIIVITLVVLFIVKLIIIITIISTILDVGDIFIILS